MAKGENLEKPKKGGMVIVIGVGAKPKKGDKSSMKKAERSHRNQIGSFRRKMMKDPDYLEQALSRRMKGMDKDFFEKYLKQVKGTSVEEAMQNKMYDFPQAINEAAKAYGKFKGRYELRGETKSMLDRKGIDHSDFQQAAKERPFDDINDLLESLQPARETRNEQRPRRRYDNEERRPRSRTAQLRNMGLDEFQIQEQLEHDRLYNEEEAFKERNRRTPEPKRELDDMDVERIARLLTARYPQEVAEEMAARYVQQGFHFNPSEHEFNVSMRNRDDDEDPNVGFSAASIGAETPKSQTANPRELPPFMSPREGQGEGMMVRPFQMQTSFDNPLNVMDAAWALLKGNTDMTDRGGKSVHPAAMNYAQYARALTDSLQYRGPQNEQEQINLERNPMLGNMDKTQGDVPDRASATLFRNTAESKHPIAQSKLGGETMREHSDFARRRAKRDTRQYMGTDESEFGSDPHIVRMPRGISNTQEEFMDN